MTTPETSDVRAWARKNGIEVADRGRLPADLRDAYLAAPDGGGGSAGTATRTTKKPAAKAAKPAGSRTTRSSAGTARAGTGGSTGGARVPAPAAAVEDVAPTPPGRTAASRPTTDRTPADRDRAPRTAPAVRPRAAAAAARVAPAKAKAAAAQPAADEADLDRSDATNPKPATTESTGRPVAQTPEHRMALVEARLDTLSARIAALEKPAEQAGKSSLSGRFRRKG